jgi:hypothetical protein
MSKKRHGSISLKSLKNQCAEIGFKNDNQTVLVSSPDTRSALATALLCRGIMKSGGKFHVSFEHPIISLDRVIELRSLHESANLIFVGIDTFGKKRIRKGKSYPIFLGGTSQSEQVESLTCGTTDTVSAAGFLFSEQLLSANDYDLQIAAGSILLSTEPAKLTQKVDDEIVEKAKEKKLIEERKGVRLFGFGFLPLDELFHYNTRPFIPGLSGNQKACDSLLNEAEIPVTKLHSPMSELSNKEAQSLTQHLTSRLLAEFGPSIIAQIMGTDYILLLESENSPLRYLSGLEAIAETSWARQEQGAAMSIWIGDRGRALRSVIDIYLSHHKDVISTIERLQTKLKGISNETSTSIEVAGVQSEILTDVGRVTLQSGIANQERPLLINSDKSTVAIWTDENIDTKAVLQTLQNQGLDPILTSTKSLLFRKLPKESRADVLETLGSATEKEIPS